MLKASESKITYTVTDDELRDFVAKAISRDIGLVDKSKIKFSVTDMAISNHTDGGSVTVGKQICTATYEEIT
jgi:hypothetical protein